MKTVGRRPIVDARRASINAVGCRLAETRAARLLLARKRPWLTLHVQFGQHEPYLGRAARRLWA